MIHYHGTPISPRSELLKLGGRSFCVSFVDHRDVEVCHKIGQSVMLDNGAFSFWRRGESINWDKYYSWCEPWLDHHTTWAVIPDVIDGTEEENDALLGQWPHGQRGAPVWHLHESLDRLQSLCDSWGRICFGSSGMYSEPNSISWHRRMCEAFDRIAPNGRVPVWTHMLRGLRFSESFYPFSSADSTNLAQNFKTHDNIKEFADRIDSKQCPGKWTFVGQRELKFHFI
jgi:hypothetical protein